MRSGNSMHTWYLIERSRNNGKFWSSLCQTTSSDEAEEWIKREHADHPSDWLRIVKSEESVFREILGNKKKNK